MRVLCARLYNVVDIVVIADEMAYCSVVCSTLVGGGCVGV